MGDPVVRSCPMCDSSVAVLLGDEADTAVYECVECGTQFTADQDIEFPPE